MLLINNTIAHLGIGNAVSCGGLTVFPLIGESLRQPDYITLRQAFGEKTARVTEVSDAGSVPVMRLQNSGKRPVLVVEGEELIGSKQNRTANVTVLAPAGKTIELPVTCVEAGRWRFDSRESRDSEQMHFYSGRKSKMASVASSRHATGEAVADQNEVWQKIDRMARRTQVRSATSAMSDVYDTHRARIDDYVRAFDTQPGQTGAAFAIGARVEGVELFDSERTLAEYLPKLVRSYALDAMSLGPKHDAPPAAAQVRAFLDALANAKSDQYPSVGLGTEVRLRGRDLLAGGLVADGRVVHLAAFASEAVDAANDDSVQRQEGSGLLSRFLVRRRARRR